MTSPAFIEGMEQVAAQAHKVAAGIGAMAEQVSRLRQTMQDMRFRAWLREQPRYLHPLMRFAYRIERLVLR